MNEEREKQEETGIRDEKGRFIEGVSGNPNGRPKGISITDLVRKELEKAPEGQQITYAQAFLKKLLHKAIIEGDHATQKLIWNYMDGLPRQNIELTGKDGMPLFDNETKQKADKAISDFLTGNTQ